MTFTASTKTQPCTVCTSPANFLKTEFNVGTVVDCVRCGDYEISHVTADNIDLPFGDPKSRALASYAIRKMQGPGVRRPTLTSDFFQSLETRSLPTPAEASDNLVIWLAGQADGSPGTQMRLADSDPSLLGGIGVIGEQDLGWVVDALKSRGLIDGTFGLGWCHAISRLMVGNDSRS
jgi:hypothetical protein